MNKLDLLYSKLDKIGFRVTYDSTVDSSAPVDIERTLIEACYFIDEDGRLLGLLFSWLKVHGAHVIPDKLFKEYNQSQKYLGATPWFIAICAFMGSMKDPRFKKGIVKLKVPHHYMNQDQTSLIKLKGAVPYLEEIGLKLAQSSLRIRESDILGIEELISINRQYRNRYAFGANWRSEIINAIQNGADTPIKVSKDLGIARSRVGVVFKEFMQVKDVYNF